MAETIGNIIEREVRKRGFEITDFADQINCTRQNLYNIFNRANIDIQLLARISKVLEHNFFEDIAKNYNLAEIYKEDVNDKAVEQFHKVIDEVIADLNIGGYIAFGMGARYDDDIPLPDYTLCPYFITFTVGETFEQRAKGKLDDIMTFQHYKDESGTLCVTECVNQTTGIQSIDIKLDYKTAEEWKNTISFAIETAKRVYLKPTLDLIKKYS